MILRLDLALVFLALLWNVGKTTASDLLAVFPKTFRPGSPLVVTCNLLKSGQKNVQLTLSAKGVNVLQNSSVVTFGKQSSIIINVPPTSTSFDITMAKLTYDSESIWSDIRYDPITCLIFLQTDRGTYAEKEKVNLRVVVLRPDLKPFAGQFSVEIFDGKNKTVQQWLDVRGTKGVYSKKFDIPKDSNLGTWRIVVACMKNLVEKTIQVRNYVIPKFKVNISCPEMYNRTTRNLKCTVNARYFFGKTVSGVIHLQFVTKIRHTEIFLCNEYGDITGEFVKSTPLNSSTIMYENDIVVLAKVSDPSTGTTVVNSAVVSLKRDGKMVWTLEPKRRTFQPGLPFTTFLKFQNVNTSSMPVKIEVVEKPLKVCLNTYKYITVSSRLISQTLNVDNQGFGKLSLNLLPDDTELKIMTYDGADKAMDTLYAANKNAGLIIIPEKPYSEVGTTSSFEIFSKSNVNGSLCYIISSRGTNLKYGHCGQGMFSSVKCSIQIEPSFYPGFQLLFYYGKSTGETIEDSVFVPVKGNPTNNFVNISTDNINPYFPGDNVRFTVNSTRNSTVYLLTIDEGIHSQSGFDLNMQDVSLALQGTKDRTLENEDDSYRSVNLRGGNPTDTDRSGYPTICRDLCSTSPCKNNGICIMKSYSTYDCLYVVDIVKGRNEVTAAKVNKINVPHNTLNNGFPDIGILWNNAPSTLRSPGSLSFTVTTSPATTYTTAQSSPTFPAVPPLNPNTTHFSNDIELITHPRDYFPRTWIWEEVNMRGNNSVSFSKKIPDTITSWITTAFCMDDEKGLGVITDTEDTQRKIQVFQPFFIKVKTPTNLVAGNKAVIQISLFNYHLTTKMGLLYVWFQDLFKGHFITFTGRNSNLKMDVIDTNPKDFGYYNITVAVYDLFTQTLLDSVAVPIYVKAPGVPQEYSIPKVMSLDSQLIWTNEIVNVSLPRFAIPATKSLYITVTGDIVAPSIEGLGHLIRRPCGCGEQTMMYLAPNIYVVQYLKATQQLSTDIRRKLVTNINIGVDSELRWRRYDGSFSVWGNSNGHGSTWLTSFVLLCFHEADQFVPISNAIFTDGLKWLLQRQNSDGSFTEAGRVIHYQMQGGVKASRVSMTAYVLLTLLELKDVPELKTSINTAKIKAVQYITNSVSISELHTSKHGMALTSYVLEKAGYPEKARRLYAGLKGMAISNGQHLYWKNDGGQIFQQRLSWQSPNPRARPIDIETSAYALLYLTEKSDMSQGMKIVNWLVSQRNPDGGFASTQDTVVSLHALSEFSGMQQQASVDVQVKVKTDSTERTVHVNPRNKLVVQRVELDQGTNKVEIQAQGKGSVLVDTTVKYNVMRSGDSAFEINTTIASLQQTFDKITVNVCLRRKDNNDNGMVVAEIGLPSGFAADISKISATGLEHKETTPEAVILYFKNLRNNKVCFDVTSNRVDKVTESQEVPITVYDYYEPDNYGIASYMTGKLKEMDICYVCSECRICGNTFLG